MPPGLLPARTSLSTYTQFSFHQLHHRGRLGVNEGDILDLVRSDPWMMRVLRAAESLDLPEWMIGAGFVRNKVWDHLQGFANAEVPTADIDLIYFDPADMRESTEKEHDRRLRALCDVNWSAKNQARMHAVTGDEPYKSAADGLAHWVESATCVAVTLRGGELRLIAPFGIDDLVGLIVRPSPGFTRDISVFHQRVASKRWLETWSRLRVMLG
jgi:uncharacterized protein